MKVIILPVLILIFINIGKAQTTAPGNIDSTKLRQGATVIRSTKTDTTKGKLSINIQSGGLEKADSADLKLASNNSIEKYDEIDTADIKLKFCDFEKDANAMVLFDRAIMACGLQNILLLRQKRIKIFNDNGKGEANIHIEYDNKYGPESILAVEAETINLNNGKIEHTKLDPKLVYIEHLDKNKSAAVFSFPNVKAGSIIDYKYVWRRASSRNFPDWNFQSSLPTRKSEVSVYINPLLLFSVLTRTTQPFVKDTDLVGNPGHVWALANIHSAKIEPFMRSPADVIQCMSLVISAVNINGERHNVSSSWAEVGRHLADEKDFINPLSQKLNDDDGLIAKTKALKTEDEKIAFLFNQVKNVMKWNDEKNFYSKDGIKNAWKRKSGNWGEVNMVLNNLLKQSGITAYPLLVSTRDNGNIVPGFINIYQINKLVIYIPVDSTKCYVLDATNRYNLYNEIPYDLLNSYGLCLNKEKEKFELVFLKKKVPVKQVVFINAEIKPNGTMKGTAQINSFSYNKSNSLELYKMLDEKKYEYFLSDNDYNLKITSLKFENPEVDSLPLTQNIDFNVDLPGTDDKYIYFNPNLFTSLHNNPFINETRVSDIDFGCLNNFLISGRYKMPGGYKVDVLPKSMNILMPDKSISFKRIVAEQDGYIIVHYVINYKKATYPKADYPDIYAYFKRMNELLNEQIVLKKS
jgi:hypothetical protein